LARPATGHGILKIEPEQKETVNAVSVVFHGIPLKCIEVQPGRWLSGKGAGKGNPLDNSHARAK
jgi:hypothetical protein